MKSDFDWDCMRNGCWVKKCQLKFRFFNSALPRNIRMTDIDAACEINGHFLLQEWKFDTVDLPVGQDLFAKRLTALSTKIKLISVHGDAANMECEQIAVYTNGQRLEPEDCNMDQLYGRIGSWAHYVDSKSN